MVYTIKTTASRCRFRIWARNCNLLSSRPMAQSISGRATPPIGAAGLIICFPSAGASQPGTCLSLLTLSISSAGLTSKPHHAQYSFKHLTWIALPATGIDFQPQSIPNAPSRFFTRCSAERRDCTFVFRTRVSSGSTGRPSAPRFPGPAAPPGYTRAAARAFGERHKRDERKTLAPGGGNSAICRPSSPASQGSPAS